MSIATESPSRPTQPLFWRMPRVIRFVLAVVVPFLAVGLLAGRLIPKDYLGIAGGAFAMGVQLLWSWAERRHSQR